MKLSDLNAECLELLNNCELNSLKYEGCILIKGDRVYQKGEIIDTLNNNSKVDEVWEEYMENSGIRNELYF